MTQLQGDYRDLEIERLRRALASEQKGRIEAEAACRCAADGLEEARRLECYYRHLTEYSLDLITILEADGTIRFESRSVTTELGWEPEEYRGRNAFDFVHPEDVAEVAAAFSTALQTHGSTPVLSFRFRRKDGVYRILEGRGNNLLDDLAVRGLVFNSRDVTDQRKMEAQLHQAQKVQAIGQLTGGVAHDFNNILTVIIGYSELALRQICEENVVHQELVEIRKAAERAAGLTRQLLAFSRRQILQPRVINLSAVLSDLDRLLRRLLGEHVEIVIRTDGKVGNVKADPGQIEQVIVNLSVNARDAMPAGGRLTIEIAEVVLDDRFGAVDEGFKPGEYVMLAVSDTGTGMTPEVMAHVFEPFFTTKPDGKGTGLGLATSHGIVKQSGGHITVYSESGQGTTFKVFLPVVREDVTDSSEPIAGVQSTTGAETILLVEDEEMLRELGVTILEELGYAVLTAANGCAALDILRDPAGPEIDLLLTDLVMPEMGGQELVRHVRPMLPEIKIIYTSGYTEDSIIWSGELEKGIHFLSKPYSVATIAEKVRGVLGATAA